LTDAVLGAAGQGDIGERFPDTADENKDRDSAELLRIVLSELRPLGCRVINVDAIVFAEAPKLSPYKRRIADNIAAILGVPTNVVNVKAKTGEKVGPIGRREAISAEVVALVLIDGVD
jgi:2-C-methyl-D-erythritol 2,4-cyclodiphosphate synthase